MNMLVLRLHLPSLVLTFWTVSSLYFDVRLHDWILIVALISLIVAVYIHTRTIINLYELHHPPIRGGRHERT